jgi:hypothetical protein
MKVTVLTWDDKSLNAFSSKREEIDSFIEWKTALGLTLVSESEMTVTEYDSARGIKLLDTHPK